MITIAQLARIAEMARAEPTTGMQPRQFLVPPDLWTPEQRGEALAGRLPMVTLRAVPGTDAEGKPSVRWVYEGAVDVSG